MQGLQSSQKTALDDFFTGAEDDVAILTQETVYFGEKPPAPRGG
jgi:hypothetical protein